MQLKKTDEFNSISIMIEKSAFNNLVAYLKTHESDIATNFEDYGTLRNVFHCFMQRPAKESE